MTSKPCQCGKPGCMAVRRKGECARDFRERKFANLVCAGKSPALSAADLVLIERLAAEGLSYRKIAKLVGRRDMTVQRALNRHLKLPPPAPAERPPRDTGASDRLLRALASHPMPVELTGPMIGVPVRLLGERGAWA
jgi:hypothetical protein